MPDRSTRTRPRPLRRRPLAEFIHDELLGGLVLLAATVAALVWANAWPHGYDQLWSITAGPGSLHLDLSLHAWVNDGLMTLFFLVVGLEIKRELVVGELSRPREAALPVLGALGGMVVPALVFLGFSGGGSAGHGWGVPMATDIAFVLGAVALLGRRAPSGLRLFLLAVAIVDDLGAIAVLALFYGAGLHPAWLAAAAGVLAAIVGLRRLGAVHPGLYAVPAVALWYCVHASGVHATVAGVLLGLVVPARPVGGREVLARLEDRLHPVSALVVVPLFALANAGVRLSAEAVQAAVGSRVAWGVAAGLLVGKVAGITLTVVVAVRLGLGRLPAGVGRAQLLGGAALAGIGFTVSLLVAELSFAGTPALAEAKLAILVASLTAAALGSAVLVVADRRRSPGGPVDG